MAKWPEPGSPGKPRPPAQTSSPQTSPPRPAHALTLWLGVALRFGQEQPAQRGQEQQRPHGRGLGRRPSGPAALAGWKLRDGARGPAATHGARPGGGVAPPSAPSPPPPPQLPPRPARGKGFPAGSPEPGPLRAGAAPGSFCRPALLPPCSRGFSTAGSGGWQRGVFKGVQRHVGIPGEILLGAGNAESASPSTKKGNRLIRLYVPGWQTEPLSQGRSCLLLRSPC